MPIVFLVSLLIAGLLLWWLRNVLRHKRGENKVLDEYGTVTPPEFFAVASESFFEKRRQMKKRLPDLYQQLQQYYGVDPTTWL